MNNKFDVGRSWLTSVLCVVLLISCGGEEAVDGKPSNSSSSTSSSSSSGDPTQAQSSCPDLLDAGKKIFEGSGNCAACHGKDGRSATFKAINLTASSYRHSTMSAADPSLPLPAYIASYMPQPGACKGACADNVSVYVRSLGGQDWCPSKPSEAVEKTVAMQALHRLNTFQHNRIVKDIFGIDYDVASQLPKDSAVGGFDNAAEGLTLPRDNVSLYLAIADDIVTQALPSAGGLNATINPSGCDANNESCARGIVTSLAAKAFRRSPANKHVDRYVALFDQIRGDGNFVALKDTVKAILISPRFLFNGTLTTDIQGTLLNPYLIANRLSFFLWASAPDKELLNLAASGTLVQPSVMTQQVARMLKDKKAEGFIDGFVGHWLALNRLRAATDSLAQFPNYNKTVKDALIAEIELFIKEFMLNDIPVSRLVDPPFGHINNALANHYQIATPNSSTMVKVDKGPGQRRGVFHLGGWHLAESDDADTNPIRRGAWVLDQLLCTPMGSPPPDAAATLPEVEGKDLSIRELLELHRTDPSCATCHDFIDPAGLGFEYFNAVGAPDPMQQSDGKFPGGIEFTNPMELPDLMAGTRQVSDCLARKLYSYAHARQLTDADSLFITDILDSMSGQENFAQVVNAIVLSPSFIHSPSLEVLNEGPPTAEIIEAPISGDIVVSFALPTNNTVAVGYSPLAVQARVTHKQNVGIEKTELYINGELIRPETKAPYDWGHVSNTSDFTAETTGLAEGHHEFKVVATDINGLTGSGTFTLTVGSPANQTETPKPGTGQWLHCANENGTCTFSGTKKVRFGANDQWNEKTATNSIECTRAVFGDPVVGVRKTCEVFEGVAQ